MPVIVSIEDQPAFRERALRHEHRRESGIQLAH